MGLLEWLTDVNVQVETLDLGSLQSVISFAQRLKTSGVKVDVLVNNAGIMTILERREPLTASRCRWASITSEGTS